MKILAFIASTATLLAAAAPALAQDAAAGGADFKQRCQVCHSGQANSIGPNMAGIVGRKAGATGFSYSPALKASGLTWDKATLGRFLASPSTVVPGTRMVVSTPDAGQRANLIAYLATRK